MYNHYKAYCLNSQVNMITKQPVVVMKFGGAALANHKNIANAAKIAHQYSSDAHVILVVSALQNITDSLYALAKLCEENNFNDCMKKLFLLYQHHKEILTHLGSRLETFETEQQLLFLTDLLKIFLQKNMGIKLSLAQIDYIVSFGERMSIHIFATALKKYKPLISRIDSAYLLKTTGDFGNAKIIPELNTHTMKKLLLLSVESKVTPIITGFIGQGKDGCITTFGRGGSDYTATSIAALINADKVILWKDIKGMYDKDPKTHTEAKYMTKVNYDDAIDMSKKGAKVLHPESIIPVKIKKIPVFIKCFLQPHNEGTIIWKGETTYA